jgi:hypothetical protein
LSGSDGRSYDAAALAARGWQSRIRVTSGDHERPHVTVGSRVRPTGRIRMSFTEGVQGIDSADVRVQRVKPDGSRGRAVLGAWRCLDRRGDRTNCLTGAVRTTRLRPAHRLRAATRYAVSLNPEHHLGITDLAGNPLRQTVRRLRVTAR